MVRTRSSARDMDAFKLMKELRVNYEQEVHYLPKETGLSLIESTVQVSTQAVSEWELFSTLPTLMMKYVISPFD